jgi:O-antigen ligase
MISRSRATVDPIALKAAIAAIVIAAVGGVVVAVQPSVAIIGVAASAAAVSGLLVMRGVGRDLLAEREGLVAQLSILLVLASLVRIAGRDALGGDLGTQALFEFALQAVAMGLVLVTMALYGARLRVTPSLAFWIAVGLTAMISAFWAPQQMIALIKGGQLIMLCAIVAFAAMQFTDRYQAIRFIVWATVVVVLVSLIAQGFIGGFGSLFEGAERLWTPVGEERYRLSALSIHPIMLGNLTAAAAILLLAHHPRGVDWVAFGFLGTVCFLTNARAAFILFVLVVLAYAAVRAFEFPRHRLASTLGVGSILTVLVSAWIYLANTGGFTLPSMITDLDERDIRTLNGRIPLWQSIFQEGAAASETGLGLLTGYGYTSFRHFGLDRFAYAGDAHNAFIQTFFEIGVIGAILWLLAIGFGAWQAMRLGRGLLIKFYMSLPVVYILATQMVDALLADSRSFLLVFLVFHAHAAYALSLEQRADEQSESTLGRDRLHGTPTPVQRAV